MRPRAPSDAPSATVAQLEQTLRPRMRAQLMQTFDGQLDRCIAEIEVAAARGDRAEMRRISHLLKGSSATFGAVRLREVCLCLERSGREGDQPVSEEQLGRLRQAASEAQAALHARLL